MAKDGHRRPSFDEASSARSTAEFAVLMAPAATSCGVGGRLLDVFRIGGSWRWLTATSGLLNGGGSGSGTGFEVRSCVLRLGTAAVAAQRVTLGLVRSESVTVETR